ncbi:transcriptional repressor LexA [Magnetococcales bacterium HHB-1]
MDQPSIQSIEKAALTATQRRVLNIVRQYFEEHDIAPTNQEIADALGTKVSTAHTHVQRLIQKGFLRKTEHKSRALALVDFTEQILQQHAQATEEKAVEPQKKQPKKPVSQKRKPKKPVEEPPHRDHPFFEVSEIKAIPIIGSVAAGIPILAVENIVGEILIEANVARGSCFALEVTGDSMIEANINDKDYIIVRRQAVAENGDVVVAMLDDEATVKQLHISEEKIELRPANPNYEPIRVGPDDHLQILGKVLAVRSKNASKVNEYY